MEILEAIFLGIVQGLTEFLPISSSGHLLLFESLGVGEPSLVTNIVLHIGTLFSVLVAYRKRLYELLKKPFSKEMMCYVVACVPTGIIALLMKRFCYEALLGSYLPTCFMLSATLLLFADFYKPNKIGVLNTKTALLSGVFQGIAVLPGVSRSGATITALSVSGVERSKAAEFSFILSIPIIILSALSELSGGALSSGVFVLPLAVGAVSAFVSGLLAIKIMLRFITKKRLWPFSAYLIIVSIISFITMY
ncbi:MAG: undecaprenyl-diphosphate phosphatase [Clostridia bacterium]